MKVDFGSISFNANIQGGGGTPSWGTALGQGIEHKFSFEDMDTILPSMVFCSVPNIKDVYCPLGKGGARQEDYEYVLASLYKKVFVNGTQIVDGEFVLLIVKQIVGQYHVGRRTLKYGNNIKYKDALINESCYKKIPRVLGIPDDAAWFINEIFVRNLDELHFKAYALGDTAIDYPDVEARKQAYLSKLQGQEGHRAEENESTEPDDRQLIYFGAPASGKSDAVLKIVKDKPHTRTIFHPDSDYASFVGTYKPMSADGSITYEFVPQAFTNAYVEAWKNTNRRYYLVIEEINRGNCAQIFGDLFQLLDRDDSGYSRYPIAPDTDLKNHLQLRFKDAEIPAEIKNADILMLPSNLYILATMNTSDQSLFPIDSAFKRRWAWKYTKITNGGKDFRIVKDEPKYDWWQFINAVNSRIKSATSSADKQLGYWFVQPKNGNVIDADTFASKVIFYLWNDVFKNCGDEDNIFDGDYSFENFFSEKGDANSELILNFVSKIIEDSEQQ